VTESKAHRFEEVRLFGAESATISCCCYRLKRKVGGGHRIWVCSPHVFVSSLLPQAAEEPKESEMRLLLISAYNIACWHEQRSRMTYRASKPVERETFEYVDPAKKFKLLIEEVTTSISAVPPALRLSI
jgi:hypothetical protein